MLSQILTELRKSNGMININELSLHLNIDRSALEGMMETLVRQGKIREIHNDQPACAGCSKKSRCPYAGSEIIKGKAYILKE